MQRIWITTFSRLNPRDWQSPSLLERFQTRSKIWAKSLQTMGIDLVRDITAPHSDPRIKVKKGLNGQTIWQVWDPRSQETIYLSSEDQVRTWVEERYYDYR